jgi:hypothetical protein
MPNSKLAVATCQFPVGHDVDANAAHIRRQIKLAAGRGAAGGQGRDAGATSPA